MKERVFVTGADGMLGASICRELLAQEYEVVAFVLPNSKSNVLDGLPVTIKYGNILHEDKITEALKGCKFVIHAAASTAVWPRNSQIIRKVNFEGTQLISKVCQTMNIERMIHIGTASSFGNGSKSNPGNENSSFNSARFKMEYMLSKYDAQNYLLQKHEHEKFPIVIINPTFMIGPFDSGPSSGRMLLALYKGKLPAYTKGGKNFVYSLDVARAVVNSLKKGKLGECYIAGNSNLSYKEFLRIACEQRGQDFNLFQSPQTLSIGIGFMSSILARITKKPPKISYTMARVAAINQFYSAEKAVKELEMPQTPIEKAIEHCTNWYEENGYL